MALSSKTKCLFEHLQRSEIVKLCKLSWQCVHTVRSQWVHQEIPITYHIFALTPIQMTSFCFILVLSIYFSQIPQIWHLLPLWWSMCVTSSQALDAQHALIGNPSNVVYKKNKYTLQEGLINTVLSMHKPNAQGAPRLYAVCRTNHPVLNIDRISVSSQTIC